MSATDR